MTKPIHQIRRNADFEPDATGLFFFDPRTATLSDLTELHVLHTGVDTVRQLYRGSCKPEVLALFDEPGIVDFSGFNWHAGRIGRDSGYQYKLQNADLGLVLLLKNFNVKPELEGPHLKIEVSPHLIESTSPDNLQKLIDGLARQVLNDVTPNQCAIHIAVDLQGWSPGNDLVDRMVCRSRRVRDTSGIMSIEHSADATTYGRGQSSLWGSASGMQCAIYNKSIQAQVIDKLDYWRSVWNRAYIDLDTPAFDPDKEVWRVEMRFHHSVIEQFALGSVSSETGEIISTRTFADLAPHLTGLFRYGLDSFRLLSSPGVIDPVWTYLAQDLKIQIGAECLVDTTNYKRYYKTASGFTGKNVDLFMGNLVSLLARERVGAHKAFEELKKLTCWPVIRDHFADKGKTERQIYQWLRDKLTERTIRWGVAV